MSHSTHVSGIRVAHVQAPDRGVRVNRPQTLDGPIEWSGVVRVGGAKLRQGRGRSGLSYRVRQSGGWQVVVMCRQREVEVGSARMQDHALALAQMWEQAVLSGRIDMG